MLQAEWQREGVSFYRAREIVKLAQFGSVDNDLFISEEHYQRLKETYGIPQPNDIMLSAVGTIGRSYVVKNSDRFYYKDASVLCLQNIHSLNSLYIQLVLSSQLVQEQMYDKSKGTTVDTITIEKVGEYTFPLPPLAEQVRIVETVEQWFELIDQLERNKQDLQEAIKQTKAKVLALAIHGKLVPQDPNDEPAIELLKRINPNFKPCDTSHYENLPDGWAVAKLGEVGKWQAGGTPKRGVREYYGGSIPWLKTGDLNDGYITDISENITEYGLQNSSAKLNPKDSILIAMYGATIGKLGILTYPATTNQACCACIDYPTLDKMYLFYFLLSRRDTFISQGGGGAQSNISKEIIVNTCIPLPPIEEQKRIAYGIDKIFNLLDSISAEL